MIGKSKNIHRPEAFTQALHILTALESAPSCNRLATANLIDSCQSLGSPNNANHHIVFTLDEVKSTFAARLAVCELQGAHAAIPSQCSTLLPDGRKPESRSLRCLLPKSDCSNEKKSDMFSTTTVGELNHCLAALESRPQWWTSYSNARQNAVVMCHAARIEIEKGMNFKSSSLTAFANANYR